MQVDTCIKHLIAHSGKSYRAVSAQLGKSPNWAGVTAQPGRDPKLSTVADVANAAGVDVALIDRTSGDLIAVIDPPRKAAQG